MLRLLLLQARRLDNQTIDRRVLAAAAALRYMTSFCILPPCHELLFLPCTVPL